MTNIESERQFITELTLVQGSATEDVGAGGDYAFNIIRAIVFPGNRRQSLLFSLNPDLIAEGTENFQIRATRSEDGLPYVCVPPCISLTTIFIQDDDGGYF